MHTLYHTSLVLLLYYLKKVLLSKECKTKRNGVYTKATLTSCLHLSKSKGESHSYHQPYTLERAQRKPTLTCCLPAAHSYKLLTSCLPYMLLTSCLHLSKSKGEEPTLTSALHLKKSKGEAPPHSYQLPTP